MTLKTVLIFSGLLVTLYFLSCFFLYTFMPVRPVATVGKDDAWININGKNIRYRIEGKGPETFVFLHGFASDLTRWDKLYSAFGCHRKVVLDIVGFGASDSPNMAYDLPSLSSFVIEFLNTLQIDNAVLVGASMGASLSAWTAANYPERIRGIVLFAPSGYPGALQQGGVLKWFYRPGYMNNIAELVVKSPLYRVMFPSSLARQALNITKSYNLDFAQNLKKIKQKSLLFWSKGDRRVPYKFHRFFLEAIPNCKFVERPAEEGHSISRHQVEATAKMICQYFSFNRRPA